MTTLNLSADVLALNPELRGAKVARVPGAPRIAAATADPYKSGLERRCALEWCDGWLVPGEWRYEPITLHIAGGRYTPDFFGPLMNGAGPAAVEVKGWGQSLDRSKAKFRAAVAEHRWLSFCWLTWGKRQGWEAQWYHPWGRRR